MIHLSQQRFDVINFDACAPVGLTTWMKYIAELKNCVHGGILAVTLLAGRESPHVKQCVLSFLRDTLGWVQDIDSATKANLHEARRRLVYHCINDWGTHSGAEFEYRYVSGRVPMMALAFRVICGGRPRITNEEMRDCVARWEMSRDISR
jgi:hypothetical protein